MEECCFTRAVSSRVRTAVPLTHRGRCICRRRRRSDHPRWQGGEGRGALDRQGRRAFCLCRPECSAADRRLYCRPRCGAPRANSRSVTRAIARVHAPVLWKAGRPADTSHALRLLRRIASQGVGSTGVCCQVRSSCISTAASGLQRWKSLVSRTSLPGILRTRPLICIRARHPRNRAMRGLPRAVLRRSQRWPCALMPARTCNRPKRRHSASAGSFSKAGQFVMPSLREHTMPHTAAECCSISLSIRRYDLPQSTMAFMQSGATISSVAPTAGVS